MFGFFSKSNEQQQTIIKDSVSRTIENMEKSGEVVRKPGFLGQVQIDSEYYADVKIDEKGRPERSILRQW